MFLMNIFCDPNKWKYLNEIQQHNIIFYNLNSYIILLYLRMWVTESNNQILFYYIDSRVCVQIMF